MSQTQRFLVRFYIVLNTVIILNGAFMTPLWSNFVMQIGGDLRTAGKAVLLFSMVLGVVTCIAGNIQSRFNKDHFFMIASQCVVCLGYAGYFFVKNAMDLYIVQIVLGLGCAFQSPVLCALYQRYIPTNETNHYWGIWNGFYQIAVGVGALLGAYLVHRFGYQAMFLAMLVISLLCLALIVYIARKEEGVIVRS